jgi:DNA modification methylase
MAEKTNENVIPAEENPQSAAPSAESERDADVTNARHQLAVQKLVAELKELAKDEKNRGFEIGDLVETATTKHKMRVQDLVKEVGLSRSRLCDCRMTAVAFRGKSRRKDVPFHFFTLAARAAKKFDMDVDETLDTVIAKRLQSTREASKHFAQLGRQKQNGKALEGAALLVAKHGDLLDRCHHDDFRNVITRLDPGSIKLVVADPPYDGQRKSTTSATTRVIDGNTAADAQAAIEDLLRLFADKMSKGGALVLFRPGAALDPSWLSAAIESNGWTCAWALTWNKHKAKPGRTDAPYGIASERVLVLSRNGERLVGHDDSLRDDVLDFKPVQPHYTDSEQHHQHEKPLDLMQHFIGKHTFEGELVVEPFGGTGPACQAAASINRHFLYCETAKENLDVATARIAATTEGEKKNAG